MPNPVLFPCHPRACCVGCVGHLSPAQLRSCPKCRRDPGNTVYNAQMINQEHEEKERAQAEHAAFQQQHQAAGLPAAPAAPAAHLDGQPDMRMYDAEDANMAVEHDMRHAPGDVPGPQSAEPAAVSDPEAIRLSLGPPLAPGQLPSLLPLVAAPWCAALALPAAKAQLSRLVKQLKALDSVPLTAQSAGPRMATIGGMMQELAELRVQIWLCESSTFAAAGMAYDLRGAVWSSTTPRPRGARSRAQVLVLQD